MGLGRVLIGLGILLILVGLLITFGDQIPGFRHLGRLPGDIRIEKPDFQIYIPITTCLLISLLLTLIGYLFRR